MLLNFADPKPLEMLGNSIAFPRLPSTDANSNAQIIHDMYQGLIADAEERLISLPARGLFAEAKLGHCNVAEEIDDTRFWKWEEHPLPLLASEIAPIEASKPLSDPPQATPTPFPQSVVNIQQPPAEPDPQGMAAALKAITTPDIFRDMSGIKKVQAMLHDLTQAAVSMAQATSKNLELGQKNQKDGQQPSGNQLAHDENMAKLSNDNNRATSNQVTPAEAQYGIKLADNQMAQGKLDRAKRDQIVANQLGNMKGSSQPPPPPKQDPVRDPLRPRELYLTIRNALNAGVWGRYSVDLFQAAVANGKLARVILEPGEGVVEEWTDGSRMLSYTPVLDRPLFYLSLMGDVKVTDAANSTITIKGQSLTIELPADAWGVFDFNSVVLTLQTDKATVTSKSTDEAATKLALSGKLNGTISGGFGLGDIAQKALSRILQINIKDVNATTGGELGATWSPSDETKTFSEEKSMSITYYTGGIALTEIK